MIALPSGCASVPFRDCGIGSGAFKTKAMMEMGIKPQ